MVIKFNISIYCSYKLKYKSSCFLLQYHYLIFSGLASIINIFDMKKTSDKNLKRKEFQITLHWQFESYFLVYINHLTVPLFSGKKKRNIYIYIYSKFIERVVESLYLWIPKEKGRIGKIIATEPKDERGLGN